MCLVVSDVNYPVSRWMTWLAVSRSLSLVLRSTEHCHRSNGKYSTAPVSHAAVHISCTVTSAVTWPEELTEACAVRSSTRLRSWCLQQAYSWTHARHASPLRPHLATEWLEVDSLESKRLEPIWRKISHLFTLQPMYAPKIIYSITLPESAKMGKCHNLQRVTVADKWTIERKKSERRRKWEVGEAVVSL